MESDVDVDRKDYQKPQLTLLCENVNLVDCTNCVKPFRGAVCITLNIRFAEITILQAKATSVQYGRPIQCGIGCLLKPFIA